MASTKRKKQSGNTFIGLVIGLVLGLGIALGVAVYVTKVPIPFIAKTQRLGPSDESEAQRNRDWDPNAPLAGKAGQRPPASTVTTTNVPGASSAPAVGGVVGAPAAGSGLSAPAVVGGAGTAPVAPTRPPRSVSGVSPDSSDPIGDLARSRMGAGGASSGTAVASATPSADAGPDPFIYFVQAGAFRTPEDAEAQRAKLSLMGVQARVTEREQSGRTVYRVRTGPFGKKEEADRMKERLDGSGMEAALVRVQR
ncbi:SPOR domain-containing protein [Variovorax dokdonensis]|uniref:SPOR domain-containing protein n=1 Tax=Variovorax dokdonensis TaxID=344883 RepID=A0ABT7NAB5_9BURK|nr:SPOR domain-containing protein [Variovorax dokdonensis]MDM0044882.1 SPOR domain-containing protein [Variovorax dokdonensis]